MTTEAPAEALAESLLRQFQDAFGADDRSALRAAERAHGAGANRAGRLLQDLLAGSHAWDLFEAGVGQGRGGRRPRVHALCVCDPVLRAMRESGEMDERERLLAQRDADLAAVWREPLRTEEERWQHALDIRDTYAADIAALAERHRAHYETLGRAASRSYASLAPPRVRRRPLLLPPLMANLFRACHGTEASGELDPMAWDLTALAVSAFHVRTGGDDPCAGFPLLLDDYFEWRGTDPRKRSRTLREAVSAKLEFLCSDRLGVLGADGPLLTLRSRIFRRPVAGEIGTAEPETLGFLLSLGGWARPLVEQQTGRAINLKRLAEYDLARQGWERRIGWLLVFRMTDPARLTPHLTMRTVLDGSLVPWEEMARTSAGKVIRQWSDALNTLHRDGVIGPWACLDGAADGSDLPTRGRLAAMLERRYRIVPGRDLLPHVLAPASRAIIAKTPTPLDC